MGKLHRRDEACPCHVPRPEGVHHHSDKANRRRPGVSSPQVEWVRALRKIGDEHGILLISDESQMALCRTGYRFAMERFGVEADLYVLG
ncbi:MAG: hypothetical protein CSA97_01140 [Bacteroidetes bacterium]|nr:MAG: hypothetical protein CSA97_01140 [Bacteroidota bacterium]